jgi:catechol 2,3-dioxygenase-like lactoylglutathione lyase family enzyme
MPPWARRHILVAMLSRGLLACAVLTVASASFLLSQSGVKRPPITGVAHVALKTNDLAAARRFYGHDLGFSDALAMPTRLGPAAWFKVNDHQYVEIYETLRSEDEDRLIEVAFETPDAKAMRDYLAAKGVGVPAAVDKGWDGNLTFSVADPEGHRIAFVQYLPDSTPGKQFGLLMPATRISEHMIHAGFLVKDPAAEDRFYHDILGFDQMWRGGKTETSADWISMRVPEGEDWLEYMCNVQNPSPKTRGIMNHVAFGVPEMEPAARTLQSRQARMPEKPKVGRDGKWQLNLYDPNLTRAELMEPKPVEPPCCSPLKPRRGPEGPVGIFTNQGPVGDATAGSKAEFDPVKQEYRITGGGANVWDTTDAFYFIWSRMSGEFSLTADVTWAGSSQTEHRKAMLMVRDGLAAGAAYADAVSHGNGLTSLQFRGVANENTYQIFINVEGPTRLRFVRQGSRFTMYAGKPGGELKEVGPVEYVRIKDPAYVGLGVSSHVATALETAVFSNVKLEPLKK